MRILGLVCLLSFCHLVTAQSCKTWGSSDVVGLLDSNILNEASGISSSSAYKRLYHMNDSGGPFFYMSDLTGRGLQTVRIGTLGQKRRDFEDIDVGPCGDEQCLYVGDIGGNNFSRDSVEIILIKELADFPERIEPISKLRLTYPDKNHDAEGLAVHPNGDIYLLTKEEISLSATPSKLFRAKVLEGASTLPLEHVADVYLRELSGSNIDLFSHVATSLDISNDGKTLLILSYGVAFELSLDVSSLSEDLPVKIKGDVPFKKISLKRLAQQESISYLPDMGLVYSSEATGGNAPLVRLGCVE